MVMGKGGEGAGWLYGIYCRKGGGKITHVPGRGVFNHALKLYSRLIGVNFVADSRGIVL